MSKTGVVLQVGCPEKQALKKGVNENLFLWEGFQKAPIGEGKKMNQVFRKL